MEGVATHWVDAPISMEFELANSKNEEFQREFSSLARSDEDPLGEWIRLAKARGETKDTDSVVLAVLMDLHRKVENLEMLIRGETKERLALPDTAEIVRISYSAFEIKDPRLTLSKRYYARVKMPVFPMRDIPLFFEAVSATVGKIVSIHDHDQKAWDSYTASRERVMIRKQRR